MKKVFLSIIIMLIICVFPVFSKTNTCLSKINGYHLVEKTLFQFSVGEKKYCFFAFYTKNINPHVGTRGNGNMSDSVWFGYYNKKNIKKIYELPKPFENDWSYMCSVNSVSFFDINDDKKPDITVIGSCKNNAVNYTFPFVFIRHENGYFFDENTYSDLYGLISLTVFDVREYIKTNGKNYKKLKNRFNAN